MTNLSRRGFLGAALAAGVLPMLPRFAAAVDPDKPTDNPVAAGNNAFTWDLYRQLRASAGNVFFSPFSIEAALGMTAAGAGGDTLKEIQTALHLPADMTQTHAGFKALLAALRNDGVPADKRGYELTVANALWGSNTFPWRKEYLKATNDNYGAGLIETDFRNPEAARTKINTWVEGNTNKKIKELLAEGTIDSGTRMVLTNAIYFKGKWEEEFDKKATKVGAFHNADGTKADASLMSKKARFGYGETDAVQAVELAYKGKETAMLVLLPKKASGLADVEKGMDAKGIDGLVKGLNRRDVQLTLPRFKVETKYGLVPPLKKLGMESAFDGRADFSGMTTANMLFITEVVHKAFVDVNEEGTEAAAATGVVFAPTSVPQPPVVFKADRPFLFVIRHLPTNTTLFAGKVEKL